MKNSVLIILQFLLLIYIVFISGSFFVLSAPFIIIQIISVSLILWALLVKRLHKSMPGFSSRKAGCIIKDGPYEFIRHPIDTGLVLFASTYAQDYITLGRFLAVLIFIIIIVIRIEMDEKRQEAYFKKEYSEYRKKTKRLIPYIY